MLWKEFFILYPPHTAEQRLEYSISYASSNYNKDYIIDLHMLCSLMREYRKYVQWGHTKEANDAKFVIKGQFFCVLTNFYNKFKK